ncbi:MAG TPA: recombinase family protein [Bryobacteraceae bacterium]|jgi:DNA invertase Pin-like site-specific DNA recombinase|nr:recombinase family protein [Bryobacteraceae bacterium]
MTEQLRQIAAIYARVSTADQDCSAQLEELRAWAARNNLTVYAEYVDQAESGRKASRPALDRLLSDARFRRFGTILVTKLDRFGRSVLHVTRNIECLDRLGIGFIATQQGLELRRADPVSRLLLHMLSAVAEFECTLIRERVRSGLAKAKRDGKTLGRPVRIVDRVKILELHKKGLSYTKIAQQLGIGRTTVLRRLHSLRKENQAA